MKVTLYLHPSCSKSREARTLVESTTSAASFVDYTTSPLAYEALLDLIARLDVPPIGLVRTKEPGFATSGLGPDATAVDVARLLVGQPLLMERPVLVVGERAIVARPPERVRGLLAHEPDGGARS